MKTDEELAEDLKEYLEFMKSEEGQKHFEEFIKYYAHKLYIPIMSKRILKESCKEKTHAKI